MRTSRRLAWVTASMALGGTILYVVRPSLGQEPTPQVAPFAKLGSAPTAVFKTTPETEIPLEFAIPPNTKLARNPRLRVLNERDELWELLPTYISKLSPTGVGTRGLHTENYPPGAYRVRVEVDYLVDEEKEETTVSPWATFTVPKG